MVSMEIFTIATFVDSLGVKDLIADSVEIATGIPSFNVFVPGSQETEVCGVPIYAGLSAGRRSLRAMTDEEFLAIPQQFQYQSAIKFTKGFKASEDELASRQIPFAVFSNVFGMFVKLILLNF